MKSYSTILFDLDGTLTDPGEGITNSVAYALKKFGIDPPSRALLYPYIGPPLIDSFEKFAGLSRKSAEKAVDYYREYFAVTGIFENERYDGITELLSALKASGKTLILATSKPTPYAVRILEHYDLLEYFTFVSGASMNENRRSEKADVIAYALAECGITDTEDLLMVGDRRHDVIGAASNQIDSVGVLYGYGDEAELRTAGATYIARTVEDLHRLLLSL